MGDHLGSIHFAPFQFQLAEILGKLGKLISQISSAQFEF